MAAFKITKDSWQKNLAAQFGGSFGIGGTLGDYGGTSPNQANRLALYKGVPPTNAEFGVSNSKTFGPTSPIRTSDILLIVEMTNMFAGFVDNTINFKETPFFAASGSGLATWFAMFAFNSTGTQYYSALIGDVSDLNGSGFIKLPNANIVANTRYSMKPMKLILPHEFNY